MGASRPPYIVHVSDVVEEEGSYPAPFDGEKLSFGRNVAKAAGSVRLGMWHERIPPGRRTSFTHWHSHEEELIYVLEGECVARIKEPGEAAMEIPLRAGHTVSFPSGTKIGHCFWNRGERDVLLLCIGERRRGEDRASYPEDVEYQKYKDARG